MVNRAWLVAIGLAGAFACVKADQGESAQSPPEPGGETKKEESREDEAQTTAENPEAGEWCPYQLWAQTSSSIESPSGVVHASLCLGMCFHSGDNDVCFDLDNDVPGYCRDISKTEVTLVSLPKEGAFLKLTDTRKPSRLLFGSMIECCAHLERLEITHGWEVDLKACEGGDPDPNPTLPSCHSMEKVSVSAPRELCGEARGQY